MAERRGRRKRWKTIDYVDYKDLGALRRYLSANGKLHSRKRNQVDLKTQRKIQRAVKRARFMGILSYIG
jgi:small subunit ribosomal protein S18